MTVEHDPMCPCFYKDTQALPNWQERCVCDLLTAARAQEREKAAQRVESCVNKFKARDFNDAVYACAAAIRGES